MPQPVVLYHIGYQQDRYREFLGGCEDAYRMFREGQNMKRKTWQGSVHEATTSMAYMGRREKLRDMVSERGFSLR